MTKVSPESNNPDLGKWSLSEEREFMENLLCQRFNFMLVLFSLFLGAGFAAKSITGRTLILGIGGVVLLLMWLTVYRAHVKHHWIMQHLYSRPEHPASIVNTAVKRQPGDSLFSVSRWIGIVIPIVCVAVLLSLSTLSWFNVIGG